MVRGIFTASAKLLSTKDLGSVPQNSAFREDSCRKDHHGVHFVPKETTNSSVDDRMTMRRLIGGTPQFKTLV